MKKTDYPGVFPRVKAFTVDSIVIIIMIMIVTDVFSRFEHVPNYARAIAFVFIFLLYEPLLVSLFGATIGHSINNIKVQRLGTGKKIDVFSAMIRFVLKSFLGWLSFFTVSTNKNRQAIHDSIVNSVVVYDSQ